MRGAIGSLNAAVAGSILLFEALAQRDPDPAAGTAPEPASAGTAGTPEPAPEAPELPVAVARTVRPKRASTRKKSAAAAEPGAAAEQGVAADPNPDAASADVTEGLLPGGPPAVGAEEA
jgi:hypothetical protein